MATIGRCPGCNSTRVKRTRAKVDVDEFGVDILELRLTCQDCRQGQVIDRGSAEALDLKDDIAKLEGKVARTGNRGLSEVLIARRDRLRNLLGG